MNQKMGFLYDFYRMGLDVIEARLPFRIATSIRDDPPTIYVSVTNHTKNMPLFINAVRIHYGRKDYTYSFTLAPVGTQKVEPCSTKDFFIPFTNTKIQHRQIVDKPPANCENFPSFDGPADLFRAIANGKPKDSWIEIDFNEFKERRFRCGRISALFAEALRMGKARFSARTKA